VATIFYNPPEQSKKFGDCKDYICVICKKTCNGKEDGFVGEGDKKVCLSCYSKARESV
jgi:hypothetical protein